MNIWRNNLDQVNEYWMRTARGARHCDDALSEVPSQHKRLCTQRSPKMTSFEEGGDIFLQKRKLSFCSQAITSQPHLIHPSVKSSPNLHPGPYIPPSPHPIPRPPPLTPTHQFLWWQAPVPDRHQRAGNIGILCHRFCSNSCLEKRTIQFAILYLLCYLKLHEFCLCGILPYI